LEKILVTPDNLGYRKFLLRGHLSYKTIIAN
jgi:hypothetical protein